MSAATLGYAGTRALVTGCASGMGRAVAALLIDLGAEVHGLDLRAPEPALPLASFAAVDLRDPDAIDAAVDALPGPVDALLGCAGLGPTFAPADIVAVNFLGLRHLAERVAARMRPGAAVGSIASTAAMGWRARRPVHDALLAQGSFAAGARWCAANADAVGEGYVFSKEMVVAWTLRRATEWIARGIRTNCVLPAVTDTPMLTGQIAVGKPPERMAELARPIGRPASPEEQAWPLVMLTSPRASYVNGAALNVDGGRLALIGMA